MKRQGAAKATRGRAGRDIKIRAPRPWGTIALYAAAGTVAILIIGYATFASWRGTRPWADRIANIGGVTDYKSQKPAWLTTNHKDGTLPYEVTPSVGGDHNGAWQNCMGTVYDAPIAPEHATHSLEHGAVWITYQPGLAPTQVDRLKQRVEGREYTLMSPHQSQKEPVSVQAWGYRLGVDSADDSRLDDFIAAARINAGPEQGATCSGGITTTGTTPQAGQ